MSAISTLTCLVSMLIHTCTMLYIPTFSAPFTQIAPNIIPHTSASDLYVQFSTSKCIWTLLRNIQFIFFQCTDATLSSKPAPNVASGHYMLYWGAWHLETKLTANGSLLCTNHAGLQAKGPVYKQGAHMCSSHIILYRVVQDLQCHLYYRNRWTLACLACATLLEDCLFPSSRSHNYKKDGFSKTGTSTKSWSGIYTLPAFRVQPVLWVIEATPSHLYAWKTVAEEHKFGLACYTQL